MKSLTGLTVLVAVLACGSTMAFAFKGQQYANEAKVTLEEARAVALKIVPGKITDEELEKERGGSGLRYSFDIKTGAATHEVGIDAENAAVLENSIEGPHSD